MRLSIGRREAVGLLGGSVAARAWGQTAPPAEVPSAVPTPVSPPASPPVSPGPTPVPTTPSPGVAAPSPTPAPRVASPPPIGGFDKSKSYYVFFDGVIDDARTLKLRQLLARLTEAGVTEITVVMSSGGGALDPTIQTYGFIRSLPVKVRMHAQGFIMSAATVLFLAADERSADRSARFLFHPPTSVLSPAVVNEAQVVERLSAFRMIETVMTQIYRERSALTEEQIGRFLQQDALILDAEQARAAGMVQSVADLRVPAETGRIVFVD